MFLRLKQIQAATIALAFVCSALHASAKEVKVLFFSFEVPDSWSVEGNGGNRLFATGSTQAYRPPLIIAEGCVPSTQVRCTERDFRRPGPPDVLQKFGCPVTGHVVSRSDLIAETRWLCSPVTVEAVQITAGIILFEANGAVLIVSYLAGDKDQHVRVFLDVLARSLKW
jgi:hypothetical protein